MLRIRNKAQLLLSAVVGGALMTGGVGMANANDVRDMSGRTVSLPDRIDRVHALTHSLSLAVALAPDLLVGMPPPIRLTEAAKRLLPPGVGDLPALDSDPAKPKALGAQLVVGWDTPSFRDGILPKLDQAGLTTVLVQVDRLDQYPASLRALGHILGRDDRGERLARHLEDMQARLSHAVAAVPTAERRRVYYAESADGLSSQCNSSGRGEVITLAGAANALICTNPPGFADTMPVSLDTIAQADPDVIITRQADAARMIRTDPAWAGLRAVRQGRVHAVPSLPFSWIDRPPSFMRALGAAWLAHTLYPKYYNVDMVAEARGFLSLFFGVAPSGQDVAMILGDGAP